MESAAMMKRNAALNTADALTLMHIDPKFDVTEWPRQVEVHLAQTRNPLHRAILKNYTISQIFTYTKDARPKLIAERIYDAPESYSYEKRDPADVVTPEMAREQLAPSRARATFE